MRSIAAPSPSAHRVIQRRSCNGLRSKPIASAPCTAFNPTSSPRRKGLGIKLKKREGRGERGDLPLPLICSFGKEFKERKDEDGGCVES